MSRKSLSNLILLRWIIETEITFHKVFECLKKLHLHVLHSNINVILSCSSKSWIVCTHTSLKQNWPWNVKWCNHDKIHSHRQTQNHKTISTLLQTQNKIQIDYINLFQIQFNVYFCSFTAAQFRKMTTQNIRLWCNR